MDRKKSATTPQVRLKDKATTKYLFRPNRSLQRPRKFPDGRKIRKKNSSNILEYDVHVVKARYDEELQSWMYTLTDYEQKALSGETQETMLG